jgi:hypothetical protein
MKRLFMGLLLVSFLVSAETEVGRYQLETITYTSKKGTVYIVETVLDTKTGKVVVRRKKKASSYKLPYKNTKGRMINEE